MLGCGCRCSGVFILCVFMETNPACVAPASDQPEVNWQHASTLMALLSPVYM